MLLILYEIQTPAGGVSLNKWYAWAYVSLPWNRKRRNRSAFDKCRSNWQILSIV